MYNNDDDKNIYSNKNGRSKKPPQQKRPVQKRHPQQKATPNGKGLQKNFKYTSNPNRRPDPNRRKDLKSQQFENAYKDAKSNTRRPTKSEKNRQRMMAKKKSPVLKRVVLIILAFLILLVSIGVAVFFYYFGGLNTDKNFTTSPADLGLSSSKKINDKVTNIALFGVDSRESGENGRSDTTMVASFDGVHNAIKLTSLMRDSRVDVDGHGKDKLCHAYSYGGPELAVKTINKNFDLDIMEYVTVNFSQMAKIIDAIGGLDIEITEKERVAANGLINSTPDLKYSEFISAFSGNKATVHLNGAQAVSYARIRKIDSETQRVSRQQTVMQALFDKIIKTSTLQLPNLIKDLMPYVETSLSYQDMLGLLPTVMSSGRTIKDYTIPDPEDKSVHGGNIKGVWYWDFDLDKYTSKLHDYIYNQD